MARRCAACARLQLGIMEGPVRGHGGHHDRSKAVSERRRARVRVRARTVGRGAGAALRAARPARSPKARMTLTYKPFTTSLRHVFTVAVSSRSTTPGMLTEIEYDGVVGYGEASMPPYLGETPGELRGVPREGRSRAVLEPVRARDDPRGHRRDRAGQPGGEGGGRHRAARSRRQADEPALVQHLGLRPGEDALHDVHHRHRHAGGRPPEGARGGGVQGAQGQARARQRPRDDRDDPLGHRQAADGRREPGLEGPAEGARRDRLAEGEERRSSSSSRSRRRRRSTTSRGSPSGARCPIIADESCQRLADVRKLLRRRLAASTSS